MSFQTLTLMISCEPQGLFPVSYKVDILALVDLTAWGWLVHAGKTQGPGFFLYQMLWELLGWVIDRTHHP